MKYFRIRPDMSIAERWTLGNINHVDNWLFIDPPVNFMEPGTYSLDLVNCGVEVDYSLAGYASVPVVSARFRDALVGLPEFDEPYMNVVVEPLIIEGQNVRGEYSVLIVETRVDCVDEGRSDFMKFEEDDPVRPDLAGQYRAFTKLIVDRERIGARHIFRIEKFMGALIVSEEVRRRLDEAGVVGAVYDPVTE